MRRLATRGPLLSITLLVLTSGCSRGLAMTPAGRTVRTLRDPSFCELMGNVSTSPGASRRDVQREARNLAGEMGGTHVVQPGGPHGWRAYRCDPDELIRQRHQTDYREIRERHPDWAELDLDELAAVRDGYWVQTGLASTLLVVGAGGFATGLGVFMGNVGRPALPGRRGTPGNDEGMLIGAVIAGVGALSVVGSIVWLVTSGKSRNSAARLREATERLMLDADVNAHGATLRLRGAF